MSAINALIILSIDLTKAFVSILLILTVLAAVSSSRLGCAQCSPNLSPGSHTTTGRKIAYWRKLFGWSQMLWTPTIGRSLLTIMQVTQQYLSIAVKGEHSEYLVTNRQGDSLLANLLQTVMTAALGMAVRLWDFIHEIINAIKPFLILNLPTRFPHSERSFKSGSVPFQQRNVYIQ